MGVILTPTACTVTVGGTPLPLAVPTSCVDALAPEVDSCDLVVPWGARKIRGAADPAETLPALGAEVVVTCGSYVWRGTLTSRHRVASGARRLLRLRAHGPGLAMDRAYLPSFARPGISGVIQAPGGPRFAPGTCSADPDGPDSTHYLAGGGGPWDVAKALNAFRAHATAVAGLPAITLDTGSADLTRELPDTETDGGSVFAGIQAILGHRLGLAWRPQLTGSGWVLRVRGHTGAGASVDCTTGDVIDYDVGEDASAALAALDVRGARRQYVLSIDGKASGDLIGDWTGGDETARAGGDRSSPAFRRFRLATFALPDGSPSTTAEMVPTLPISASTSLISGSSPWLLFAQRSSDSVWESLQGKCSIHCGGSRIWIEGIDPAAWSTWSRIRLTLCLAPRGHLSATRSGGGGLGRGLAIVGTRHTYASSAATRISGSSLATVTGSAVSEQDPVDDTADALWASLSGPQIVATVTRDGIAGGAPDPGQRVTEFLLPVPGAADTAVACDTLCLAREIRWTRGRAQTTWRFGPRPFASGALAR